MARQSRGSRVWACARGTRTGGGSIFSNLQKGGKRIEGLPGTDFNPARTCVPSETTTKLNLLCLALDNTDAKMGGRKEEVIRARRNLACRRQS